VSWRTQTAEAQSGDDASMLELYRSALRIRRAAPELGDGTLEWLDAPDGALAFARGSGFVCIVNVSAAPVSAPRGTEPLVSSGALTGDRRVPKDTTAWFAR
jgi:alpha-glucosidase